MNPLNQISGEIVRAAIAVHRALGPGLLESAYETCLAYELVKRELKVERQKPLPIRYNDVRLDCGYRLDLVVNDSVIVELKAVQSLEPIHEAQLLSYLKLADMRLGLLINFHVRRLRDGVRRIVNNLPETPAPAAPPAVNPETTERP